MLEDPNESFIGQINQVASTPIPVTKMRDSIHLDKKTNGDLTGNTKLSFNDITFESSEVNFIDMKCHPNYMEKRYKDAIYLGLMTGDQRFGKGLMKYKNGR